MNKDLYLLYLDTKQNFLKYRIFLMCPKFKTIQTFGLEFIFEKINTFEQGCIKLIKSDRKYFYNVTKVDFYFK